MILFPGTKINLGLRIVQQRSDGFHDIETVFYPLSYGDVVEAVPADTFSFAASGLSVPGKDTDNLAVKAWHLMKRNYNLDPVSIHLHKVVPPGTGLGGGSADAAAIIRILNDIYRLNLPAKEMRGAAATLGADCAFFIDDLPAFATGKGDRLAAIPLNLTGYRFAVVLSGIHISTPKAYGQCKPAQPETSLKEVIKLPVEEWKGNMINDFEYLPVVPKEIHQIKENLYAEGALYASMSGSGSAVYGIFKEQTSLQPHKNYQVVWI